MDALEDGGRRSKESITSGITSKETTVLRSEGDLEHSEEVERTGNSSSSNPSSTLSRVTSAKGDYNQKSNFTSDPTLSAAKATRPSPQPEPAQGLSDTTGTSQSESLAPPPASSSLIPPPASPSLVQSLSASTLAPAHGSLAHSQDLPSLDTDPSPLNTSSSESLSTLGPSQSQRDIFHDKPLEIHATATLKHAISSSDDTSGKTSPEPLTSQPHPSTSDLTPKVTELTDSEPDSPRIYHRHHPPPDRELNISSAQSSFHRCIQPSTNTSNSHQHTCRQSSLIGNQTHNQTSPITQPAARADLEGDPGRDCSSQICSSSSYSTNPKSHSTSKHIQPPVSQTLTLSTPSDLPHPNPILRPTHPHPNHPGYNSAIGRRVYFRSELDQSSAQPLPAPNLSTHPKLFPQLSSSSSSVSTSNPVTFNHHPSINKSSAVTVYRARSLNFDLSGSTSSASSNLNRSPSSLLTSSKRLSNPGQNYFPLITAQQQRYNYPYIQYHILNIPESQSEAIQDTSPFLRSYNSMSSGTSSKPTSFYPLRNLPSRNGQVAGGSLDIIEVPPRSRPSASSTASLSRQPTRPQNSLPQLPGVSKQLNNPPHLLSPVFGSSPLIAPGHQFLNHENLNSISSNQPSHTPSSSVSSSAPTHNYRGDYISGLNESSSSNLLSNNAPHDPPAQHIHNHFSRYRLKTKAATDENLSQSPQTVYSAQEKNKKASLEEKSMKKTINSESISEEQRKFPAEDPSKIDPIGQSFASLPRRRSSRQRTRSGVLEIRMPRTAPVSIYTIDEVRNEQSDAQRSSKKIADKIQTKVDTFDSSAEKPNWSRAENSFLCHSKMNAKHKNIKPSRPIQFSKCFNGPDCFKSTKQSAKRKRRDAKLNATFSDQPKCSRLNQLLREKVMIYFPIQTLGSLTLLIGIGIAFLVATSELLVSKPYGVVLLLVFIYSWLISLSSMFKTVGSDPGILPRGLDPSPEMKWNPTSGTDQTRQPGWIDREVNKKEKLLSGLEAGEWELLPRWIKVENKAKFYSINKIQNFGIRHDAESLNERDVYGSEDVHWIQSKWCSTCESYRPPRSSHCRICDCCIEGIDHHCNYLNNCIGARNYRTFFAFLVSCVIDLIIIIGCSIWKIVTFDGPSQGSVAAEAIKRNALSVFVVLISILMLIPVSALTGYHVFLTLSDLTTVEYIKSQTAKKVLKENKFLVEQNYGKDAFKTNSKSKSKNLSKVKGARGQNDYNYDQEGFRNEEEGEDSHTEGVIKTSLKLVLARLCRPGTETWVEWNSYSNFEEDNLDGSSQNYHQSFGAVNQDSHDLNNFDIKLNNNGTRNKETD